MFSRIAASVESLNLDIPFKLPKVATLMNVRDSPSVVNLKCLFSRQNKNNVKLTRELENKERFLL